MTLYLHSIFDGRSRRDAAVTAARDGRLHDLIELVDAVIDIAERIERRHPTELEIARIAALTDTADRLDRDADELVRYTRDPLRVLGLVTYIIRQRAEPTVPG